jgi:hypothetical protein
VAVVLLISDLEITTIGQPLIINKQARIVWGYLCFCCVFLAFTLMLNLVYVPYDFMLFYTRLNSKTWMEKQATAMHAICLT